MTDFKETEIGRIPKEWKIEALKNIVETKYGLVDGPFGSNLPASDYTKEGIPVIRGSNLSLGQEKFNDDGFVFVSKETADRLSRAYCKPKDIIFTKKGTIGQVGIIPKTAKYKKYLISSNQMKMSVDQKSADSDFVYFQLSAKRSQKRIIRDSESTGVPKINLTYIKEFKIALPPYLEQVEIAKVITTLDDKITLLRQQNHTLETLAQTLFRRWFVDFEFPNAQGQPYRSAGGRMMDSELGEVPEGWEVKRMDEIANVNIGRTPPRKQHQWFSTDDNDIKWISIRDMGNAGAYIHQTAEYLTREAVEEFRVPIIPINTVILSFKLTVGRVSITTENMLSNEAIAHLNLLKDSLSSEFLYLYLKQYNYNRLGSTSSIATAVNSKTIKGLKVVCPSKEIIEVFQRSIVPVFAKLRLNTFESKNQLKLRDTLLPKLMNGTIRVPIAAATTTE